MLLVLSAAQTSCFLGYNSEWGAQKRAQRNTAHALTPTQIKNSGNGEADAPSSTRAPVKTLHVHLYATKSYAAQVLDWQRRFYDTLDDVNEVFVPTFNVRLDVSAADSWNPNGTEDKIHSLQDELKQLDQGKDVDWVIGLVGSVPRFETSFHELGVGELVGNHVVIRAITNAAEYQAIEVGLANLSDAERTRLRRARHEHKVAAVLLHELAHTLGALHEPDRKSLMNPTYDEHQAGYSPMAIELMRFTLANRLAGGELERESWQSFAQILEREPNPWVPAERDDLLARIRQFQQSVAKREPAAPAAATSTAPSELNEAERQRYDAARALQAQKELVGAWKVAEPLFSAYPTLEPVQDLRCQLAMQLWDWSQASGECAAFMKLQPKLGKH